MPRPTALAGALVVALLAASPALADEYLFGLMGSGTLLQDGADYSGTFMYGMLATWEIDVDDSLWPDQSDSTARFGYIWNTFFAAHYDDTPGAEAWYGYFDGSSLPAPPRFTFETIDPGGTIAGLASLVVMVRDLDGDAVLSQAEKHRDLQLTMTMVVDSTLGTDYFAETCGHGASSSGNFRFVNPPEANSIQIVGRLHTYSCDDPVEGRSWGLIKALFRDVAVVGDAKRSPSRTPHDAARSG